MHRLARSAPLAVLIVLAVPAVASARSSSSGLVASADVGATAIGLSIWALAIGVLVPLVTYTLNRLHSSEPVAGIVTLVATTVAGALTQLVDAGTVSFDSATLRYVLAAVIAALGAHHFLYKSAGVNVALGRPHDVP